ncbi:replication factor C subunit 1 [Capronia epimyces CBS 606.96]|uniref:Replication factor C subunit 1 n=1 Tax=Capronia epimyces CBS 606.96 TaxID=1182542 RepID=W9Y445_9EURO|nr:replication factor C subunit 1 [Capronia epimyces CBS 606.96]EXJ77239.1 replication factor C subunit 1 [Capronia epimyces CBS 606.96]
MPDIRSFFGGGGGGAKAAAKGVGSEATKKNISTSKQNSKQRGRARKVVSDDEDDDEVVETKPKKSSTPKAKRIVKEPVEEEITSSAYFASSKASRSKSTPIKTKAANANGTANSPSKTTNAETPSSGRRSTRKTTMKNYTEDDAEIPNTVLQDDSEGHDDIFNDFKSRKVDDDYEEGSDADVLMPQKKNNKAANGNAKKPLPDEDDDDVEVAEIPIYDRPGDRKKRSAAPSNRKRKSKDLDEDEDNDFLDDGDATPKKKPRKTTATTSTRPRAPAKKEEREESKEIQDILSSIPTVRAPTPPPRDENKKFTFQPGGGNASVAPPAAGTAEIPVGAENCLTGLTFVFTGVLNALGREEGQNLVKQYGGKVTGAPSKKTSYVVIGSDAGPKKLETIQKLGIKTINEEGLFELIKRLPANGGDGKAAEAYAEKQAKEDAKIRKEAEEMERREKERQQEAAKVAKAAAARTGASVPADKSQGRKVDDRLWVDKYAPDSLSSVCGNKSAVEGLQRWLRNWPNNAKSNFKKAGADGKGIFRAALLHGPPGVGKTTAAHLVAKLEGYDIVESNASETRNKKLLEQGLTGVLDTTSLLGYFAGDGKKVDPSKKKIVLIMDEVDGMSAGDRGGVGALAAVAKKTHIPMILICNERNLPKMKPFYHVTAEFQFRRPTTDMIRGRIATILFREGMKLPPPIMNALIEGCNGDIRQIVNMISTIKLDNKDLEFSDTKAMSKAWEKHVILKPWDIVSKILRPQMFAPSSTATLNDKTELYFNDHEFSYLMLQENYLKTQPSLAASYHGKERDMKMLELIDNAASSISDGDLVDRMIHGSQQQWSLMPVHAIFSFVQPASFVYGNLNGQVSFAGWLGQNSKQGKLSRFIKEIQGHMRLRANADRNEVRQQYLPALWDKTVGTLQNEGKEAVQDVIDFMDSYYLTKDDFDAMLELGVGPMDQEKVKLETATKATFTRLYNSQSHPMPFVKASNVLGVAKGAGPKEKPDLEEAVDESEPDEVLDVEAEEAEDEALDLKKDKYIKAPKKKSTAAGGAKGKGKRKKDGEDADGDDSEEPPKKKRASGGGGGGGGRKGKGRA